MRVNFADFRLTVISFPARQAQSPTIDSIDYSDLLDLENEGNERCTAFAHLIAFKKLTE